MSKKDKLIIKLQNGTIKGRELEALLRQLGWYQLRQVGSHQTWSNGEKMLVLIAGRMDLKPYQIKEAKKALLED